MMKLVDVELRVIPDCPYSDEAHALLRQALDDVGLGHVVVRTTVIATDENARVLGFVGSPTFVIDGHDPFATAGAAPAVACRLYPTSAGIAALPELSRLRQELARAAERDAPPSSR
jgi:hypothetical protein